jgi:hypothetical protein
VDARRFDERPGTLPFGYGARVQADRYGFMVLELRSGEDNFGDEQLTDHVREMAHRRKSA